MTSHRELTYEGMLARFHTGRNSQICFARLVYGRGGQTGDYKLLDTSLHFIITNFHSKLNSQVKVSHGMNTNPDM